MSLSIAPRPLVTGALALFLAAPAAAQHHAPDQRALAADPRLAEGQIAPVLEGIGENRFKVTTSSARAQAFFDQGLSLTYAFNHAEALRAFKEAARLDPDCAMAYWGWAFVLGPNLNLPMKAEVVPQASEAIDLAREHRGKASAKEQALIDALAQRYTADPAADRAPLDAAYATAMAEVRKRWPQDNDVATLYADALMELSPWNYWTKDGAPREHTPTVLAVLEEVLGRDAKHEGALHYYIHAVEAVDAKRAERAADQLRGLAPSAGHLVHMPSHIWIQLGRYEEAEEANVLAAKADESYITQCRAQGIYPLNYYSHNLHFIAWSAATRGRSQKALEAARKLAANVPADLHGNDWGQYETFLATPLLTLVRFGRWDEILTEREPGAETPYLRGVWRYARGLALLRTGRADEAAAELAAIDTIVAAPEEAAIAVGYSTVGGLLTIARSVLAGELAAKARDWPQALYHLDRAVRLEDALTYNEPPDWLNPARHTLGAVLLEAGFPAEAEVVFWRDLSKSKDNGFALFGLLQALKAQDKSDAAEIERRLKSAWSAADVELTSSRF